VRWSLPGGSRARRHRVGLAVGAALALAIALALWVAEGVADSPTENQLFLGRLHPLLVHLPIGFLLLTVVLEGLSRTRRFVRLRHAVPLALVMSAIGALGAVLAGYLLAESGGYSGALVGWHGRLGISVAVGSLLAAALHYAAVARRERRLRVAYSAVLAGTVGLVVAAGHLGGTLTRGPDYLTEYLPAPLAALATLLPSGEARTAAAFTYPDEAVIYEHLVAPVLRERCVSCHGPDKQKGDLRLDSPEAIAAGGTSGPVLVPGRAAESRMVRRVWLPAGHEDVMPPRGRQPLPAVEAELLRWWIDEGASFDAEVGRSTPPAGVLAILEQVAGPAEERVSPVLRNEVAAADSAAVAAARAAGVALRPVARGSHYLRAACAGAAADCGGEQLRALLPLADHVVELDLSGTAIEDADLETVARLHRLTRLSLDRTAVGDPGLARLDTLRHLEYLNLYGTAVTDAGLAALEPLTSLRSLYLWRTGATAGGAARLAERLPRVNVSLGMRPTEMDSLAAAMR
jgi:uncharacterized membrane protein